MKVSAGITFDGIIDGNDGAPGANGKDSVRIDLDNQSDMIACDSEGKVRFDRQIVTRARIYDGGSIVKSGVTRYPTAVQQLYGKEPTITGIDSDGWFTFKWTFAKGYSLSGSADGVDIKLKYNGVDYIARFTLTRTDATAIYQLWPSVSSISFARGSDGKTLTPSSQTVYCGYTKIDANGTTNYPGNVKDNLWTGGTAPYNIFYRYHNANGNITNWAWAKDKPTLTIQSDTPNVAIEYVLSSSSGYLDVADSNIIDRETIPIVKDGLNGENSVRLALDNEHEDFIYDDTGTNKSGNATSQARLYDGATEKTGNVTEWRVSANGGTNWGTSVGNNSGDTATASIDGNGLLTVSGLKASVGKVKVRAKYNNVYHYADFTGNKTNSDKYDLVVKPNAIAFNTSETWTDKTITLSANRTDLQGNKTSNVTIQTNATAGLRLYYSFVKADGSLVTSGLTQITSLPFKLGNTDAINYSGIYFELRYYTDASNYRVCDYETVEIAKTKNGAKGDKGDSVTSVDKYFKATYSQSAPAWDSTWSKNKNPTDWSATYRYLWCREYTNFSNGDGSWGDIYLHSVWGQQGPQGNTGHTGRWYEYAGDVTVTDSNKDGFITWPLKNSDDHGWFVKGSDGNFYMLIADTGVAISEYYKPVDGNYYNSQYWELMGGDRKYYIGEAFFGKYAHFGSFIINDDWMISQNGTLDGTKYNGGAKYPGHVAYTFFDPAYPLGSHDLGVKVSSGFYGTTMTQRGTTFNLTAGLKKLKVTGYVSLSSGTTSGSMTLGLFDSDGDQIGNDMTFSSTSVNGVEIAIVADIPSEGIYHLRGKTSSTSVRGYILKAEMQTFVPNFAVDGLTGSTYQIEAYIRGTLRPSKYYYARQSITVKNTGSLQNVDINEGVQIVDVMSSSTGTISNTVTLPDANANNEGTVIDIYSIGGILTTGYKYVPCIIKAKSGLVTEIGNVIQPLGGGGYSISLGQKVRVYCNGTNWVVMEGHDLVTDELHATNVNATERVFAKSFYGEGNDSATAAAAAFPANIKTSSFALPANPVDGMVLFCKGINAKMEISSPYHAVMTNGGNGNACDKGEKLDHGTSSYFLVFSATANKWIRFKCD